MPSSLSLADQEVLDTLKTYYDGELEFVNFFDAGSTARVFHVRLPVGRELSFKVDRIVKVFRHDGEILDFPDQEAVFNQEVRTLISISNTNIVSIYATGSLQFSSGQSSRFYVMEYIKGAADLDLWLRSNSRSMRAEDVLNLLIQACQGLHALHSARVLHCDIKFGNLLVGDGPLLKVADLGFSKEIRGGPDATALLTTLEPLPDMYKNFIKKVPDTRRILLQLPRERLDSSFDLHYFGRVIVGLLNIPEIGRLFDSLVTKSLALMAERLDLDQQSRLRRYGSIQEVEDDLRKLLPVYLNRPGVPELSTYTGTRTIRIPVTGSIPFTPRVERIISHPLFLRLHSALQLGFTYFVFPGASHSRFEHSLGVFANVARYINSLLSDDYQPYFRQVIDEQKIATVLLAGLVHDVGQHSFAHSLEDIGLAPPHEKVARSFISGEGIQDLVPDRFLADGPLGRVIAEAWPEVDLDRLLWIITGDHAKGFVPDVGWEVMRSIVNGPLDADKTDYLLRDAHHAGVEYARSIDLIRFMNSLTAAVARDRLATKGVVAITWKGAQSAENIILARSQMFWVLYWHHAVRSAHGSLAECAFVHLENADEARRRAFFHALYCGTVGELLALLEESHSPRASHLATLLRHRRLYKRGIDLDYRDDDRLYMHMLTLKEHFSKEGDLLLKSIAKALAEEANTHLGREGSSLRLQADDLMVDIPTPAKDRLGAIFVVDRNEDHAREYTSRAMLGTNEDWQNRVRTIRIFIAPHIEKRDREIVRRNGRAILGKL